MCHRYNNHVTVEEFDSVTDKVTGAPLGFSIDGFLDF